MDQQSGGEDFYDTFSGLDLWLWVCWSFQLPSQSKGTRSAIMSRSENLIYIWGASDPRTGYRYGRTNSEAA
ncbi:hypothetical protein PDIG_89240 [Penicillium digitatum PHI26]|uniref:Uncharacterized protein n=2 Tax=Penicillium digitatum TaxID=36651 RepID=K9FNX2_PEND2|nr:hypothetical protein PDIP_03510 [Penicillium digitatum Pd1]EKV04428.1 hypothetical protein PDIG_89240 [Penicillium digitatum PHI26]EKV21722.1 hypothetical protein PDIP_03510 [Penicillium digitatum Pd1]